MPAGTRNWAILTEPRSLIRNESLQRQCQDTVWQEVKVEDSTFALAVP